MQSKEFSMKVSNVPECACVRVCGGEGGQIQMYVTMIIAYIQRNNIDYMSAVYNITYICLQYITSHTGYSISQLYFPGYGWACPEGVDMLAIIGVPLAACYHGNNSS